MSIWKWEAGPGYQSGKGLVFTQQQQQAGWPGEHGALHIHLGQSEGRLGNKEASGG